MDEKEIMTAEEVMAVLHCSTAKLWELFASGELPSTKIGKRRIVRRSDVEALIARRIEEDRMAPDRTLA